MNVLREPMPDLPREPVQALPQVLPPEEANAAILTGEAKERARQENVWLEDQLSSHTIQAAALRKQMVEAHIENLKADRGMRVKYAGRIMNYLELYSGGVLILLLLAGFRTMGFQLDKALLTALVGSTALAAIGLVGFVARGLFRSPPDPPKAP